MPVPSSIADLSQTAGSNSPAGSESPSLLDDYQRSHASFIARLRDGAGYTAEATVASAATADIGAATSFCVQITGTTTITSFGTAYNGPRFVRFAGILTLTHNATTLILPGAANITTAAGDTCVVVPTGSPGAGWRVVAYERAANAPGVATNLSGTVAVANGGTGATTLASGGYLKGAGTSAVTSQTGIPASDITSGTVATARLGSGTANSSSYLRGDQTWATIDALATIAAASVGAVGTFAWLVQATGTATVLTAGTTYAGSDLRYYGLSHNGIGASGVGGDPVGGTPSGTWRAMGTVSTTGTLNRATLFLRIS